MRSFWWVGGIWSVEEISSVRSVRVLVVGRVREWEALRWWIWRVRVPPVGDSVSVMVGGWMCVAREMGEYCGGESWIIYKDAEVVMIFDGVRSCFVSDKAISMVFITW